MDTDGPKLHGFYSELFGWKIDTNNPMSYGVVTRDGNTTPDGTGIGGGIGVAPEGYPGHVTFYDVVQRLLTTEGPSPLVAASSHHAHSRLGGITLGDSWR